MYLQCGHPMKCRSITSVIYEECGKTAAVPPKSGCFLGQITCNVRSNVSGKKSPTDSALGTDYDQVAGHTCPS